MVKALKAMLGAGIALSIAKWIYDECVAQYQMHATNIWCDGYLDALEGIRDGSNNSTEYAHLGKNGERVVVDAERLRELEELEETHCSASAILHI